MEFPLISVVIPTYSRPQNLTRAIDSVLAQTYNSGMISNLKLKEQMQNILTSIIFRTTTRGRMY